MFTILASKVAMKTPIDTIPKTIHLPDVSSSEKGVVFHPKMFIPAFPYVLAIQRRSSRIISFNPTVILASSPLAAHICLKFFHQRRDHGAPFLVPINKLKIAAAWVRNFACLNSLPHSFGPRKMSEHLNVTASRGH